MEEIMYLKDRVYNHRKELHKIAEEGRKEFKTSAYIKKCLEEMGIEYDCWLETGVAGIIKGRDSKKTSAFRADIDGLTAPDGSVQHLCGHDGHTSILLGLIEYINDNRDKLVNDFVFIFQPAEEGPGGAKEMVDKGIMKFYGIDEIYGLHVSPEIDEGKVGVRDGFFMSKIGELDIEIKSKSAHGAMPQNGIDGIIIAADIISSLQTVISRNISPIDNGVISIGKVTGGARRNIVAESVKLEGTIRCFTDEVFDKIVSRIRAICSATEMKYGCSVSVDIYSDCLSVINDSDMYREFKKALSEYDVVDVQPQMGSEDFSCFQRAVPGFFFNIGTRNVEKGYVEGLHNIGFNFDEKILLNAIDVYRTLLIYKGTLDM
ncbi:amidohydrolase [Peptacetobacter hominis]|uniref:Amidohydrolase n=1 Tax=Peptacetobacter hominis TaxID=2743610 RepID=A0A544QY05_9FIRM|nr:amidohydrolase [Peptacetobacter hominis]TQQ85515.1 amidohydrolase [Peptacetobacter hominis]